MKEDLKQKAELIKQLKSMKKSLKQKAQNRDNSQLADLIKKIDEQMK